MLFTNYLIAGFNYVVNKKYMLIYCYFKITIFVLTKQQINKLV